MAGAEQDLVQEGEAGCRGGLVGGLWLPEEVRELLGREVPSLQCWLIRSPEGTVERRAE